MANPFWPLILCVGLNSVLADGEWNSCYKCVSLYVVNSWHRLGLGHTNPGEEVISSPHCSNASKVHGIVKCVGDCALLQVIGQIDGQPQIFGALRGCASSRALRGLVAQLDSTLLMTEIELPSRKVARKVRFQVCSAQFCNGIRPSEVGKALASSQANSNAKRTFLEYLIPFLLFVQAQLSKYI